MNWEEDVDHWTWWHFGFVSAHCTPWMPFPTMIGCLLLIAFVCLEVKWRNYVFLTSHCTIVLHHLSFPTMIGVFLLLLLIAFVCLESLGKRNGWKRERYACGESIVTLLALTVFFFWIVDCWCSFVKSLTSIMQINNIRKMKAPKRKTHQSWIICHLCIKQLLLQNRTVVGAWIMSKAEFSKCRVAKRWKPCTRLKEHFNAISYLTLRHYRPLTHQARPRALKLMCCPGVVQIFVLCCSSSHFSFFLPSLLYHPLVNPHNLSHQREENKDWDISTDYLLLGLPHRIFLLASLCWWVVADFLEDRKPHHSQKYLEQHFPHELCRFPETQKKGQKQQ